MCACVPLQAHALRQNTVQRLLRSVALRSFAFRSRNEHSPQSILLRIQIMRAASLSCSDLAGPEGQGGAPPEGDVEGSARQGSGRPLAEATEGSAYEASVSGPTQLQFPVTGASPWAVDVAPVSRYSVQASALQQQPAPSRDSMEASTTLQQQQWALSQNSVQGSTTQQQLPAWVKSETTSQVSVQEFGSYVAQYMPHASPSEQALLGWRFRLHLLTASREWHWLLMLCVAGSIGMLASETSSMDQATLWRMVQANWGLTGVFFVDVALRLLSSLRPADILQSGPDCFQVSWATRVHVLMK